MPIIKWRGKISSLKLDKNISTGEKRNQFVDKLHALVLKVRVHKSKAVISTERGFSTALSVNHAVVS